MIPELLARMRHDWWEILGAMSPEERGYRENEMMGEWWVNRRGAFYGSGSKEKVATRKEDRMAAGAGGSQQEPPELPFPLASVFGKCPKCGKGHVQRSHPERPQPGQPVCSTNAAYPD